MKKNTRISYGNNWVSTEGNPIYGINSWQTFCQGKCNNLTIKKHAQRNIKTHAHSGTHIIIYVGNKIGLTNKPIPSNTYSS